MQDTILKTRERYDTWDIFKGELEINIGHYVPVNLWLQMRPNKPLPWLDCDLEETILNIRNAES